MSRLLVIRGGALGDFVLTLPILAALRRRFPRHRLEILGYPPVAALALAGGLADDAHPIESPDLAGFFVPSGLLSPVAAQWFQECECIISYIYDSQNVFRTNVQSISPAQYIAGPHRPDETLALHATEQLLQPLRELGLREVDPRPHLILPAVPAGPPCIALHPGSGSERKNWPEAGWAELLKLLTTETVCDILLIGGEAEGDRCARLAAPLPAGRVQVAQNLPLVALARRMQTCFAFVGHDSGITHLAAALDLPGLALWGDTNLAIWRAQSDRFKILRHPGGLTALPVAAVWAELKALER